MELSVVISEDKDSGKTQDTIESVLYYATNQVLLISDKPSENVYTFKGFHNQSSRNVMLGLLTLAQKWPDSDWYCHLSSNCLIGSNYFKKDLKTWEKQGIWCLGSDFQVEDSHLPLVDMTLKAEFKNLRSLISSCVFLHRDYVKKAMEIGFFEKFLYLTNDFPCEDDILDYLLPTACKHWGGAISQFSKWNDRLNIWTGNFKKYPIRRYELSQKCTESSIIHPANQQIREFHKVKRNNYVKR